MLGLLSLPFGIFSPFAIWSAGRSLSRIRASRGGLRGTGAALIGLLGSVLGALLMIGGAAFWLTTW